MYQLENIAKPITIYLVNHSRETLGIAQYILVTSYTTVKVARFVTL